MLRLLLAQAHIARALRIALYSDMQPTRFTLGLCELLWGALLLSDPDAMGFPRYGEMHHFADQNVWGWVYLTSGALQWGFMLANRVDSKPGVLFACCNMLLWIITAASLYYTTYPHITTIVPEIGLSCASVWVFVRTGNPGRRAADV